MLWSHPDLFETPRVVPWEPRALSHTEWLNRDYAAIFAWRIKTLDEFERNPLLLKAALAFYARPENAATFIMHWLDTYDPRRPGLKWMPFVFFKRQEEFIQFLTECMVDDEGGLVEKARDMGATWLCCGFSVWAFLFVKDIAIGWGSRKQELVDRLGDPDSIFEKMRQMVDRMPPCFRPRYTGTFMKIINNDNGATLTGESGDNIGRGGRKKMYFKDESAHYERPELIEAALGDNTNVQIDISSVNGLGNVFYRRRKAGVEWPAKVPGKTRVFIFRYTDHPAKDRQWFETRRAKYENEGMSHVFAQEVERNYSAAVTNTIIPMVWIDAARDAHLKIPGMLDGPVRGGFDVGGDDGGDTNAIAEIKGVVLRLSDEWGSSDPGVAARKAIGHFRQFGRSTVVNYDNIGIGQTVKSEINRLRSDPEFRDGVCNFVGWDAGAKVMRPFQRVIEDDPESKINKDFFYNMKAQAWWSLRVRFLRTYQRVVQGVMHPPDQLISLSMRNPLVEKLIEELAQPTSTYNGSMQMIVDKKPDGTSSPNLADAAMMGYFPIDDFGATVITGGRT